MSTGHWCRINEIVVGYLKKLRSLCIMKRNAPAIDSVLPPNKVLSTDRTVQTKVRKKMYAVLMMYSGVGYYGMQRNLQFPTIEGELLKALCSCGYLDEITPECLKQIWFQRASKTDRSVSAVGQVCSMLLPHDDGNIVGKMNNVLPEQLRIIDVVRVTRSFAAHTACSHRVYEYMFPTFALAPRSFLHDKLKPWSFRLSAETLTLLNTVLCRYQGAHNFYNFTSGRTADDRSCVRYIMSMKCLDPFLLEDRQYAVISVTGQSFMMHQIRKMVGLVFAIVRGHAKEEAFDTVFGAVRMDVPKAPGLGLMLKQVAYDRYNERFGKDGVHKPITWDPYQEQISCFQLKYIYKYIDQTEVEEESMLRWLDTLELHQYSYRERGNSPLSQPAPGSHESEKAAGEGHALVNQVDEEAVRVSVR